ncbi:MAG: hypothetical protein HY754_15945 [Nitrospirae bacterium]|nr:hypothetical protein [Nitrospirota bacterium]
MSIVGYCIMIGILAFSIGLLLLFVPDALKKFNEFTAKMIARIDVVTFKYRIGFGVSLLIAAAFLFFMAYYFSKRY